MIEYRKTIDNYKRERRSLTDNIKREKAALLKVSVERDHTSEALAIARTVAEDLQRDAHERIAGLVTRCLSAVFGDDAYEFKIVTEQKRGRTEARAVFVRDDEEFDALSSIGGGVIDVAAFALRVSVLLTQTNTRRVLLLDESFRFVSADYRPAVRDMLEMLSHELDVQIISVTHISDLEIGNVITIK